MALPRSSIILNKNISPLARNNAKAKGDFYLYKHTTLKKAD